MIYAAVCTKWETDRDYANHATSLQDVMTYSQNGIICMETDACTQHYSMNNLLIDIWYVTVFAIANNNHLATKLFLGGGNGLDCYTVTFVLVCGNRIGRNISIRQCFHLQTI